MERTTPVPHIDGRLLNLSDEFLLRIKTQIKKKHGKNGIKKFATWSGINYHALSQKLSGFRRFREKEMSKIRDLLGW